MCGFDQRSAHWQHFALAVVPWLALVSAAKPASSAGGAFQVDDAEVAKAGFCKVESWLSYADNRDFIDVISPACVFDITRPVELNAQFMASIQTANGERPWC